MALPSTLALQIRRLQDELEATRAACELANHRARRAFMAGLVTGGFLAGVTGVALGFGLGVRARQVPLARSAYAPKEAG